jgi:hypothetical protein
MDNTLNQIIKSISLSVLILLVIGVGYMDSQAKDASLAKATFYVYWYDVGKAALEGLNGVKKVKNGWQNLKEINRVSYDPDAVTIDEMEAALKKAKTYQGTAEVYEPEWFRKRFDGWAGNTAKTLFPALREIRTTILIRVSASSWSGRRIGANIRVKILLHPSIRS